MKFIIKISVFLSVFFLSFELSCFAQTKVKSIKNTNAHISIKNFNGRSDFSVTNDNNFPISIQFNVTGENFSSNVDFPYAIVIPPKTDRYAFTVQKKQQGLKWKYRYKYKWTSGSIYAKHDKQYRYKVPFPQGKPITVGQSCFGSFSHTGAARYSIDFIVPQGTPIHAAREGFVVSTKYDSDEGGRDESFKEAANYVKIVHPDGTVAQYLHLKQNGVVVQAGQEIARGEMLGYSGNTGYSTTPHLHFSVNRRVLGNETQSLPFVLTSEEGEVSCPQRGEILTVN